MPVVLHWGKDLGELSDADLTDLADAAVPAIAHNAVSVPLRTSVLPMLDESWQGHPALRGAPGSGPFELRDVRVSGPSVVVAIASATLAVELEYALTEEGLLAARATVTNESDAPFVVDELNVMLPLPARANEILDFTGRWGAERRPQRRAVADGVWMRESRHGRPGHDSAYVVAVGTDGFRFRSGEIWALHVGWTGNQRAWVEHVSGGRTVVGAGELLAQGELVLDPGESYSTPWVYGSWSDRGLDGVSERFHSWIRRTSGSDRHSHPAILNTWEAVYFDHDDQQLELLADLAARVGLERFVLDDGWMAGRTSEKRGLGDWIVDRARRPDGLHPLISHVERLGLDFGLWVEPEMVTSDSVVAREHPDWLLHSSPGTLPLPSRHQYALDLSMPAVFDHLLAGLDALLDEYPIRYLKWDHNRDLLVGAVHAQTVALYRLIDELRSRHPDVDIEACASGGGRMDLEIAGRVQRFWASDDNDALERQSIYRWSSLLLPPELLGAHVGARTSHLTGRTHDLSFRLATALFGWSGVEWDLRQASESDLAAIADWVAAYKELRGTIHSGTVVRVDRDDDLLVHGVVSKDRSEAVFSVAALRLLEDAVPASIRFAGLDPDRRYAIEPIYFGAPPKCITAARPPWLRRGSASGLGRTLEEVGVAAPPLAPEQALVLRLRG